jgi:hypothetical protein
MHGSAYLADHETILKVLIKIVASRISSSAAADG